MTTSIGSTGASASLRRTLACAFGAVLVGLSGCSSINSSFGTLLEGERIDYKSAGRAKTPSLEIPPDLTQIQRDNRYALPESARGIATASGFSQAQASAPAGTQVAPQANPDIRIERSGNQRWLVVRQAPEQLWPQIRDFWQDSGFLLSLDSPSAGVMETDWAENRAKIPQDFLRRTLGKVLDSLYSTAERDKFRTRIERTNSEWTEVYISHRGAQEVLSGADNERTVWTARPSDPELEAEFLTRLMAHLGVETKQARTMVASAMPLQARARLVSDAGTPYVEVDESFDRAWRRVGLALDRVGFTVEDRNRADGVYFVRYVDQETEAKESKGFLSRVFSFGSKDDPKTAQQYRVAVKSGSGGDASQVIVQDKDGNPESSQTSSRILSLLAEQLK